MVSSGDPTRVYLDSAVRHVMLRQGVLGIKVGPGAQEQGGTVAMFLLLLSVGQEHMFLQALATVQQPVCVQHLPAQRMLPVVNIMYMLTHCCLGWRCLVDVV